MRLIRVAVVVFLAPVVLATTIGSVEAKVSKACKLLRPTAIEKVLEAPAKRSEVQGTQVAGAESCSWDVGPGVGEPGGALVVLTYYSGSVASGVGADVKSRAEPLSSGVVWDPLLEVAYVIKKKRVVGVNIAYTNSQPPAGDLKPQMARLAKIAFKRT